jgi:hypothetical protein
MIDNRSPEHESKVSETLKQLSELWLRCAARDEQLEAGHGVDRALVRLHANMEAYVAAEGAALCQTT